MPIVIETDAEGRFMLVVISGLYGFDEWQAAMSALLVNPAFNTSRRLLIDRRSAAPPTVAFVDQMVGFFRAHREAFGRTRGAIVASEELGYAMARMTELKSEQDTPAITMRTFMDYDDAVRWLTTETWQP